MRGRGRGNPRTGLRLQRSESSGGQQRRDMRPDHDLADCGDVHGLGRHELHLHGAGWPLHRSVPALCGRGNDWIPGDDHACNRVGLCQSSACPVGNTGVRPDDLADHVLRQLCITQSRSDHGNRICPADRGVELPGRGAGNESGGGDRVRTDHRQRGVGIGFALERGYIRNRIRADDLSEHEAVLRQSRGRCGREAEEAQRTD